MAQEIDPNSELTRSDDDPVLEAHRNYVRSIDQEFSKVYGLGGGAVVLLTIGAYAALVLSGALGTLGSIIPAIGTGLIGLWFLRIRVRAKRTGLHDRVLGYCATNELEPHRLREYYRQQDLYPYFEAVMDAGGEKLISE